MTQDDLARTSANLSAVLQRLTHGYQFTQALFVATWLEIPDLVADGPRPVAELATSCNAHAPSLSRLLRSLATLGVFVEVQPDVFGQTPLGELLRTGTPDSQRASLLHSGGDLLHSVQTGGTTTEHLYDGPIFGGHAGEPLGTVAPLVGRVVGVKSLPIEYRNEGKPRSARIDGALGANFARC